MQRSLQAELLDHLPADDPRAIGSRRDLERVNASMGNAQTMARAVQSVFADGKARRLVEIGAGDGRFALGVARKLGADCAGNKLVSWWTARTRCAPKLASAFEQLGWKAEIGSRRMFLNGFRKSLPRRRTTPSSRICFCTIFRIRN